MRVEWRFEKITRHTYTHSIAFSALKFVRYWNVILPGSKRYLGGSRIVGANGDVRPPAPDEVREGGIAVEGIALTASGRDEAGHAGPGRLNPAASPRARLRVTSKSPTARGTR
jgi:hypothetical protein